ncbi:MAG: ASKHA domain-containing protein [Promethearchaeota archaeon]
MTKITITFQPDGKRVEINRNQTIFEAALKGGIDLISICGGKGVCGKCKVIINQVDAVNKLTAKEKDILTQGDIDNNVRLACCILPTRSITIRIPEYSRTGKQKLQIEGINTPVKLDPSIKKIFIELKKPTLEDPKSDVERLKDALYEKYKLSNLKIQYELLKNISTFLRDSNWKLTVLIYKKKIISIELGDTSQQQYGYAVDIGTTKLAGYLLDLNDGNVIAATSLMNPQIPYGEDVIARINYQDPNSLNEAVIQGINDMLIELLEKTGVEGENIYEMTAVGNTAMHHLFFNLESRSLGFAPYPPVLTHAVDVKASKIGIKINPAGRVYFLPLIAGFVGADTIGVILATELYKKEEISLALDIGTNTEVVIGNKNRMIACSCASGPAFEGAHITFGMRAASGAIEKVEINPETYEVIYKTIDDALPIGICGSAMIDLVAEMCKTGIINIKGTFNKDLDNKLIRKGEKSKYFIVAAADGKKIKKDIIFTQGDIRQITLAKAAMQTGIRILMKNLGVEKDSIENFFLAGAFGSHINKKSARFIGIYPEIDLNKVRIVGNAAGTGARMCLASDEAKQIVESIYKKIEYIELAADKDFQNEFLNANYYPYADLNEYPEVSKILKEFGNFPEKLPRKF